MNFHRFSTVAAAGKTYPREESEKHNHHDCLGGEMSEENACRDI